LWSLSTSSVFQQAPQRKQRCGKEGITTAINGSSSGSGAKKVNVSAALQSSLPSPRLRLLLRPWVPIFSHSSTAKRL
jgi:hypothetical protein